MPAKRAKLLIVGARRRPQIGQFHPIWIRRVEQIIRNDGVTCSNPVSGTTSQKIAANPRSSQGSGPKCGTKVRHTVLPNVGLTLSNDERIEGRKCITLVHHNRVYGVWRRGTIYQFRIRVPRDVRDLIGRTHLGRSLKTDSFREAQRLAARCALEASSAFDAARQRESVNLLGAVVTEPAPRSIIRFEELCDLYLCDPTSPRTSKSVDRRAKGTPLAG